MFKANTRCQYLTHLERKGRDGFGNIDFVFVGVEKENFDESVLKLRTLLSRLLTQSPGPRVLVHVEHSLSYTGVNWPNWEYG